MHRAGGESQLVGEASEGQTKIPNVSSSVLVVGVTHQFADRLEDTSRILPSAATEVR
jgi:hypothetical protein